MPIIMPFGVHGGSSIEEVAIHDYEYFSRDIVDGLLKFNKIRNRDAAARISFVEYVVNNFVSEMNCTAPNCSNTADFIEIFAKPRDGRKSSIRNVYCSTECFEKSLALRAENRTEYALRNGALYMLRFRAALSPKKEDTNALVRTIAKCMGLSRKDMTKGYLEKFFDECELRRPYIAA
jgi:hypothetical protein